MAQEKKERQISEMSSRATGKNARRDEGTKESIQ